MKVQVAQVFEAFLNQESANIYLISDDRKGFIKNAVYLFENIYLVQDFPFNIYIKDYGQLRDLASDEFDRLQEKARQTLKISIRQLSN